MKKLSLVNILLIGAAVYFFRKPLLTAFNSLKKKVSSPTPAVDKLTSMTTEPAKS